MKLTSKNPRKFKKETNFMSFRCKYCGELHGQTQDGRVGMYSLKILRHHELICSARKYQ